jgi:hypothetical protein
MAGRRNKPLDDGVRPGLLGDGKHGLGDEVAEQVAPRPQVEELAGLLDEVLDGADLEQQEGRAVTGRSERTGDRVVMPDGVVGDAGVGHGIRQKWMPLAGAAVGQSRQTQMNLATLRVTGMPLISHRLVPGSSTTRGCGVAAVRDRLARSTSSEKVPGNTRRRSANSTRTLTKGTSQRGILALAAGTALPSGSA